MLSDKYLRNIERKLSEIPCVNCGGKTEVKIVRKNSVVSYNVQHGCNAHKEYLIEELKRLLVGF